MFCNGLADLQYGSQSLQKIWRQPIKHFFHLWGRKRTFATDKYLLRPGEILVEYILYTMQYLDQPMFIKKICDNIIVFLFSTDNFIKKVPGVYTHSMETIYLSLVHTGSRGNLFHKIPGMLK